MWGAYIHGLIVQVEVAHGDFVQSQQRPAGGQTWLLATDMDDLFAATGNKTDEALASLMMLLRIVCSGLPHIILQHLLVFI